MPKKEFDLITALAPMGGALGETLASGDIDATIAKIDLWLRELGHSQRDLQTFRDIAERRKRFAASAHR